MISYFTKGGNNSNVAREGVLHLTRQWEMPGGIPGDRHGQVLSNNTAQTQQDDLGRFQWDTGEGTWIHTGTRLEFPLWTELIHHDPKHTGGAWEWVR